MPFWNAYHLKQTILSDLKEITVGGWDLEMAIDISGSQSREQN